MGRKPQKPTNLAATRVSGTRADLTWRENADNETGLELQRRIYGNPWFEPIASLAVNAVSYSDTTIAAGVTYEYRLRAVTATQVSPYSNAVIVSDSVTTPTPPLPSVPTGVTATPGDTEVTIRWSLASNATSYTLQRSVDGGGFSTIASGLTAGFYLDTGRTNDLLHAYKVASVNSAGTSAYSSTASCTPTDPDVPPPDPVPDPDPVPEDTVPAVPTNLVAVAGNTQVVTSCSPSAKALTYTWSRGTVSLGPYTVIATTTVPSYTHTGLSNGTPYYFVVKATNNAGTSANSSQVSATPAAPAPSEPAAPTTLAATIVSTGISLTWTDNASNETAYQVERKLASGSTFALLATKSANVTSHIDTTAVAGVSYQYRVRAMNSSTPSAYSNTVTAATPSLPNPVPSGNIFRPATTVDLQTALASAIPGDTIEVTAGATYTLPEVFQYFLARARSDSSELYITVQSSRANEITAPTSLTKASRDAWVQANAPLMAKLRGKGGAPVLQVAALAHHYKFIGIDFSTTGENPATVYTSDMIDVAGNGSGVGGTTTFNERLNTHHIIFDRCFIHPAEVTHTSTNLRSAVNYRTSGRAMHLGGHHNSVINCDIRGFGGLQFWDNSVIDAYGVYTTALPADTILIENNYVETHTMNIFTGGGSSATANEATMSGASVSGATLSQVANLVVGDYVGVKVAPYAHPQYGYAVSYQVAIIDTIVGNVVTWHSAGGTTGLDRTPTSGGRVTWRGYHLTNLTVRHNLVYKLEQAGGKKGYLELKDCVGGTIEANVFDGEWASDAALTPRNQDGASPWSQTSDIIFRNNKGYFSRCFTAQGTDNEQTSVISSNILVENNLGILDDGAIEPFTTHSILAGGCDQITYAHNTFIEPGPSNSLLFTTGAPLTGLTFEDNIGSYGAYGFNCQVSPGTANTCWPSLTRRKNVYIVDHGDGINAAGVAALYPNDFAVATIAAVGFVDPTIGGVGSHFAGNWRLSGGSSYNNAASDGADIGCDIDALEAALA